MMICENFEKTGEFGSLDDLIEAKLACKKNVFFRETSK